MRVVFARSDNDLSYMACDGGVLPFGRRRRKLDVAQQRACVATQLYSIGVSQTDPFLLGGATQDQGSSRPTARRIGRDTGAGNEGGFFIVDP